jgi:ubiquinone/menaquinone biosynthesis C-methylase UbiE
VLEVGVGVGANFPYYQKDHVHITAVDFSSEMIKSAKRYADALQLNVDFIQKDVEELDFEPNSFDCIVSTLSLCSYTNPIQIVENFNNWCKKDGKILLLEHGLSSNKLLSVTQKIIDPIFIKVSGCHCNRNITKIIQNVGLNVERKETYWKGIIQLIWAKPSK